MDHANDLKTRPTYEKSATSYLAMLNEMRDALSDLSPNLTWTVTAAREVDYGPCSPPYSDIRAAESGNFDSGFAKGGIADSVWPQAKQAVVNIAARHGFTTVTTLKDKPGDHMLVIHDQWGGSVELGSLQGTTLAVFGPCLLRAAPRPSPAATT